MKFQMSGQHYNYPELNEKTFGTKTTIEFEAETLDDILEEFTMFLRGCGFLIEGTLDIISDEEFYGRNIHTNNSMD
ncbi:MAG: hypothetical protein EBS86_17970 [Crocinitomicaceae bacterium]|nr:hypothetical protein [Crocinitomicaceae bacterium]